MGPLGNTGVQLADALETPQSSLIETATVSTGGFEVEPGES